MKVQVSVTKLMILNIESLVNDVDCTMTDFDCTMVDDTNCTLTSYSSHYSTQEDSTVGKALDILLGPEKDTRGRTVKGEAQPCIGTLYILYSYIGTYVATFH